ncbi:MAG TPA: metal-dependent transcriptional regulator [Chitinophagaceae bacterium]|nr:metal-dependent transcriptional regulator [Chitinophagaceae bacterium]
MAHFSHHSEENYLKTLHKLSSRHDKKVNNISLARALKLNPATVLEMVRKLSEKKLVQLSGDKSIKLTAKGEKIALITIRRHRLWEVFLVEKLNYNWDEVHALAEQLEHIESKDLTDRLDSFLNKPAYDPHGDPIPDKNGKIRNTNSIRFSSAVIDKSYTVLHLADTSDAFLEYLGKLNIKPGTKIKLKEKLEYDQSCIAEVNKRNIQLSEKATSNIMVH